MAVLNTGLATPSRGFTIDQSLRFNAGDSAYLTRTSVTPTDTDIWTLSFWAKRTRTGVNDYYFYAGHSGTDKNNWLIFDSDDYINLNQRISNDNNYSYTDAKYRDPSSWYHVVYSWSSGTRKIYINGELETFSSNDEVATAHSFNVSGRSTEIGRNTNYGGSPSGYLDGYLAEVHFIDGTALTPSSFGETGDYGEWKPIEVTGLTYGDNGYYLSFEGGGIMSATGGDSTDTDGDYKAVSFTQDGTFTPSADGYVEYLVIAGGGGGGGNAGATGGGGGGAGGYRTGMLPVTASTAYSITVGDGGARETNGDDSVFSTITSTGGGQGAESSGAGAAGGSGGGGSRNSCTAGGAGTAGQGFAGAAGCTGGGDGNGGGGGAGAVGAGGASGVIGGAGGVGLASSITGSSVFRAGGGGGGGYDSDVGGAGGNGGGGKGADGQSEAGTAGTPNTGGGGGGGGDESGADGTYGGAGGSGIVIIRYKFQ